MGGLSLCRTKIGEHPAFVRRTNTRTKVERLRAVRVCPVPFGFRQAASGFRRFGPSAGEWPGLVRGWMTTLHHSACAVNADLTAGFHTAVLSKTSHANCCTTLTKRPLRPSEGRFVRVVQQLACEVFERTAVGACSQSSRNVDHSVDLRERRQVGRGYQMWVECGSPTHFGCTHIFPTFSVGKCPNNG